MTLPHYIIVHVPIYKSKWTCIHMLRVGVSTAPISTIFLLDLAPVLKCCKWTCMLRVGVSTAPVSTIFICPSRDGPYYVIGYGGQAGVHTGFAQ